MGKTQSSRNGRRTHPWGQIPCEYFTVVYRETAVKRLNEAVVLVTPCCCTCRETRLTSHNQVTGRERRRRGSDVAVTVPVGRRLPAVNHHQSLQGWFGEHKRTIALFGFTTEMVTGISCVCYQGRRVSSPCRRLGRLLGPGGKTLAMQER